MTMTRDEKIAARLVRKGRWRRRYKGLRAIWRMGLDRVYDTLDHAAFVHQAAGDDMRHHGAQLQGCIEELSRQAERTPPSFAVDLCEDLMRTGDAVEKNAARIKLYLRDR